MKNGIKKPELLAPAGNLEKLKTAIRYGADAVYCGGYNFGLRHGADNFNYNELLEGADFAHSQGAEIHITVNMIPHNEDLEGLPEYLYQLEKLGVDGLIISDPGVLRIIRQQNILLPLHLSTQANTVNWQSVKFWQDQGIERIILARELNRKEIAEIRAKTDAELEVFIHGSMCISYSGRCLLSNYMAHRDANRGKCAHSCRWHYFLQEEKRPGEYYPVFEDERGTYIMNSRDLCLLKYIPELIDIGVDSFKIEGRMKSVHYVAAVTAVYRQAIDSYLAEPADYHLQPEWEDELKKVSHRGYTTGFYPGSPGEEDHNYETSAYQRDYDFMGIVKDYLPGKKEVIVEVRNKFFRGDVVEFIGPGLEICTAEVKYIIDKEGKEIEAAPHPHQLIRIPVSEKVTPGFIIRRLKDDVNE